MFVKGWVVIVIGVGGGLGCEYVLLLVKLGVKVVVNDYGGILIGEVGCVMRV